MSKVKIQGNASGTGVLTVTAPNTDTDRTITLPDSTGTLATTADTTDLDGAITINESGADVDFRVESDTDTHALFLQGSDGSIGVGISTPVGDSAKTVHLANNVGIGFGNGANSRPAFQIRSTDGSKLGFICGDGSATEDIAMSTAGVLAVPNGIELGSGTDFTAANTLDDYEEGTWTPTLEGSAGGTGSWNSGQASTYTKVGRLVTFNAYLIATSLGSSSNALIIGGLPFTSAEGYYAVSFGYGGGLAITAGHALTGFLDVNSNKIYPRLWNATTGTAAYGFYLTELSADGELIISGTYQTS